ncbi:hypothetical protein J3458_009507 [Metarhizium acridum]|uniref:uncharacterized protein n=1 Tax=Metarhizium acridum TaxID=92637 RepID=UPI001C6ADEC2|nr:hypothetical protein J3458_009507 [Metarhizium acridum]
MAPLVSPSNVFRPKFPAAYDAPRWCSSLPETLCSVWALTTHRDAARHTAYIFLSSYIVFDLVLGSAYSRPATLLGRLFVCPPLPFGLVLFVALVASLFLPSRPAYY